jgi:hypothetical protein
MFCCHRVTLYDAEVVTHFKVFVLPRYQIAFRVKLVPDAEAAGSINWPKSLQEDREMRNAKIKNKKIMMLE